MSQLPLINLDDVATWPREVRDYADVWVDRLHGSTKYTADLQVPLEGDEAFRRLFAGYRLRAIHCTRLLAHERAGVVGRGLRLAGADLVNSRIWAAHESGAITEGERDIFLVGHVFADEVDDAWKSQVRNREAQICFVVSARLLDRDVSGVEPLLSTWGGEVIYFPLRHAHPERLRSIGTPSLVIAALDVASFPSPRDHFIMPALNRLFVAARLELDDVGGSINYRSAVPPHDIVTILQPGDAEYDCHRQLPRR